MAAASASAAVGERDRRLSRRRGDFANSPSPVQQKTSVYSVQWFGLSLLETGKREREAKKQAACKKIGPISGLDLLQQNKKKRIIFISLHALKQLSYTKVMRSSTVRSQI